MNLGLAVSRVQAVIFDLDGVICNTEPLHIQSWQILFAKKGIKVPEPEIQAGIGRTDLSLLEIIFAKHRIKAKATEWQLDKRKIYLNLLQQSVPAFPGAVPLIKRLSWNWPLGIASSAWRIAIETITRRLDVRKYFKVIIAREDVARHKPASEPFLAAAVELRVAPADCAVIEDSVAGVEAAKRAGMLCIAVTNSFSPDQLKEADLVVGSLEATEPIHAFLTGGKT
jgi:HAD superfamily hydrolase (TIGR01509 family)